jgi:ABC-type spermidine/putrescine transport system permease subunit I
MPALIVAAESFTQRYGNDITAVITLLVAFAIAYAIDRALQGREQRLV